MLLSSICAGLLTLAQVPEPPPPSASAAVRWRAPKSCPGRAALLKGIQSRLGRSLQAGELGIDGVVTAHPGPPLYRLNLGLTVGGQEERRTLNAKTCASLVDATAVLAVLAVESRPRTPPTPVAGAPAQEPTREPMEISSEPVVPPPAGPIDGITPWEYGPDMPEEAAPEEPAPTISPEPPASSSVELPSPLTPLLPPRPSRGPGGFVRLNGGPELGALPGVTGWVGLAGGLLWRRARLELQGLYLAPRTGEVARGELRAWLAAGGVHGCARLGRRRILEVPLCGGLELGGMRGDARNVPGGRSATNWWFAAVVGAGVVVRPTPRWGVWAALQMAVGLVQPGFSARDPGPGVLLFRPAPVTGRLVLGVELRFGDPR